MVPNEWINDDQLQLVLEVVVVCDDIFNWLLIVDIYINSMIICWMNVIRILGKKSDQIKPECCVQKIILQYGCVCVCLINND